MKHTPRLRVARYQTCCATRGLHTQEQQATAFGMSESYISRVQRGLREVNAEFIAGVLNAWPDLSFWDLFEVVQVADNDTEQEHSSDAAA